MRSQRETAYDILPLVLIAAHHDEFEIIYRTADLQLLRDYHNSGYTPSRRNAVGDVVWHGLMVVSHKNPTVVRSPSQ
ncbi:MAG TPA: hypothetical protein VKS99_11720 [Blastocatellia bacterium]|nr:hypothetical protein [Blastocatellia bacterium]